MYYINIHEQCFVYFNATTPAKRRYQKSKAYNNSKTRYIVFFAQIKGMCDK